MMMKVMKLPPKNGDAFSGENFIGRLERWDKVQKLLPPLIMVIMMMMMYIMTKSWQPFRRSGTKNRRVDCTKASALLLWG